MIREYTLPLYIHSPASMSPSLHILYASLLPCIPPVPPSSPPSFEVHWAPLLHKVCSLMGSIHSPHSVHWSVSFPPLPVCMLEFSTIPSNSVKHGPSHLSISQSGSTQSHPGRAIRAVLRYTEVMGVSAANPFLGLKMLNLGSLLRSN